MASRLGSMILRPVIESEYDEVVKLANWAYRGAEGLVESWNVEGSFIGGPRLRENVLRADLAAKQDGALLVAREEEAGPVLGTVWLNPVGDGEVWFLSLLTVRPDQQKRHLGRSILTAAEEYVRERGARRMRMTVLAVREPLIAWYERRGYAKTGETEPYPENDARFGTPLQEGLYFAVMEKAL